MIKICLVCKSTLVNGYEGFDGKIHWVCNACGHQWTNVSISTQNNIEGVSNE